MSQPLPLFQANIRGNSVHRVELDGRIHPYCTEGLQNPVGVEVDLDGLPSEASFNYPNDLSLLS